MASGIAAAALLLPNRARAAQVERTVSVAAEPRPAAALAAATVSVD
jgi:hypothetical protein